MSPAAELASHRRRLLEFSADPESDPTDAILLRVDTAHIAAPVAHNGTPATDGIKAPATDSRPPATTDLRLISTVIQAGWVQSASNRKD